MDNDRVDDTTPDPADAMTDEEKRRDQLLRAEGSTEADAAPRIQVSEHDGTKRIDIDPGAAVRPGLPD
jgi:hypothetical protein